MSLVIIDKSDFKSLMFELNYKMLFLQLHLCQEEKRKGKAHVENMNSLCHHIEDPLKRETTALL